MNMPRARTRSRADRSVAKSSIRARGPRDAVLNPADCVGTTDALLAYENSVDPTGRAAAQSTVAVLTM